MAEPVSLHITDLTQLALRHKWFSSPCRPLWSATAHSTQPSHGRPILAARLDRLVRLWQQIRSCMLNMAFRQRGVLDMGSAQEHTALLDQELKYLSRCLINLTRLNFF